jgi:hypothetical protein
VKALESMKTLGIFEQNRGRTLAAPAPTTT